MLLYKLLLLSLLSISTVLTKKAYFNVTSFLDLIVTNDVIRQTTLSFRTCTPGGALISQGDSTNRAELSITNQSKLKLSIKSGSNQYSHESVGAVTDNSWYELTLQRSSDIVTLTLKRGQPTVFTEIVSSSSKNSWILSVVLSGDVKLGLGLNGCLQSSAHAPFDDVTKIRAQDNVEMDTCPLETNTTLCDACSPKPCLNNGKCEAQADGTYICTCPQNILNLTAEMKKPAKYLTGYNGTNCEENIDECMYPDFCMNGGICENGNSPTGFYNCRCSSTPKEPDWKFTTGPNCQFVLTNCDLPNFPKCVNGKCNPTQFGTSCTCDAGWKGDRCEINIDECETNPCMYGGKCIDGIANYTCDCVNGTKGENCSINIDDCGPVNPCKHGTCLDLINDFNCNCTDSGFKGPTCEINIDDCATNNCKNGGTCVDKVKDYQCDCHKAYKGKDCQTDIVDCLPNPCNNGTCYEKSHEDNYSKSLPGFPAVFNHSTAEGKVCVCEPGYKGDLCQIDIDECEAKPCAHGGNCTDGRNMFTCSCPGGWTGKTCEQDVDECDKGNPCLHGGQCLNTPGSYNCQCQANTTPLYGGRRCTTILTGCVGSDCKNDGLCRPAYDDVTDKHSFTCVCDPDFTGEKCQEQNTMTFDGSASLEFTGGATSLSFDFKTSLSGAILAQTQNANASEYVIIELLERRIDVTYKSNSMTSSSRLQIGAPQLNDGQWRKVELIVKPNSLNVTVGKCGLSQCSGLQILQEPLATTLVKVATFTNSDQLSSSKQAYHGCLRDLRLNGQHKLPKSLITTTNKVKLGCLRTEVCGKDWCNGFTCVDLWTTFKCHCERPHYGQRCEKRYPAVTLGSDGTTSLLSYSISTTQAAAMEPNTEISFACRVAKQTGFLFYLGNLANPATYMSLELIDGQLTLRTKLSGQTTTDVWRTGLPVGSGDLYLITMIRKGCQIEYTRSVGNSAGSKSSVSHTVADCVGQERKLTVTNLYVGSLPQQTRRKRAVAGNVDAGAYSTSAPFSGTLQDMQIGNLQIKVADDSAAALPNALPPQTKTGVKQGVVTPDLCKDKPCKNSGTCVNKSWNDFTCTCTAGWRGKTCELTDRCSTNPCPTDATCHNTGDGFSCSREVTLKGSQSLVYTPGTFTTNSPNNNIKLKFRTREKTNQNLVMKIDSRKAADKRNVALKTTASGHVVFEVPGTKVEMAANYWDGKWHQVEAFISDLSVTNIVIDGKRTEGPKATTSYSEFTNIIVGNPFKGCLNDVQYADYVLPVYDNQTLKSDTSTKKMTMTFAYDANYEKYRLGCHGDNVCDGHQCFRGATCKDEWNHYTCVCPAGYSGDRCEVNIDDCVKNECRFGLCRDGVNKYTCDCYPGYSGSKCETEVNECNPNPCQQNAKCDDRKNDFFCTCPDKYGGKRCEIKLEASCRQNPSPCKSGTCTDKERTASDGTKFASYECACPPGKEGADCGATIGYCRQQNTVCKNGGVCKDNATTQKPECECKPGYSGADCGVDVDECASKPCNYGVCLQDVNAFSCSCNKGWKGDRCDEDVNECTKTAGLCKQGTCENLPGSYKCNCGSTGYLGVHCENRGPCADVTCQNSGTCKYVVGTLADYVCQCARGWRGRHCDQDIPECTEVKPCQNGATCTELQPLYNCTCKPGFTDENCSTNINECKNTPCLHGGKCEDGINKYTCACADTGYQGVNCEKNINECLVDENICNGGNCTDLPGNFTCDCGPDWKGPTCATSVKQAADIQLALVIGPIVAVVILLFLIGLVVFIKYNQRKRMNVGNYNPNTAESDNGVRMRGLKKPQEEPVV